MISLSNIPTTCSYACWCGCPEARTKIDKLSLVHTSCKCESDTNVDVTYSQRIFHRGWVVLNSLRNIAAKTELWRQIHVKFASHSQSQEVWTGLYNHQLTGTTRRHVSHVLNSLKGLDKTSKNYDRKEGRKRGERGEKVCRWLGSVTDVIVDKYQISTE